uniref:Seed oleosin isoform 1 n=1 Tax=Fagopyrum esculentum TaxID=3617 RepID=Q9FYU5_FAGES|nr:seed oleosin isoform 1 [Fagopyrum esculentum]
MADQHYYHQAKDHTSQAQQHGQQALSNMAGYLQEKTPPTQHIIAAAALIPLGGFMLVLAALTLTGTVIGLAVATPLFVICSPVLVPAALALGLATMGFIVSGALGLTALSALSWMISYIRQIRASGGPGIMGEARWRVAQGIDRLGEKTKDLGRGIQDRAYDARAHEVGRTTA